MLASSAIERGLSTKQVKPMTIQSIFFASPLSTQPWPEITARVHLRKTAKTGGLGVERHVYSQTVVSLS